MNRNPITPGGYQALLADLDHHRQVLRPQNVRDIEEARAHGDISENAEFEAAKDRQAQIEGQIRYLERLIATADIIDVARLEASDRVVFGTTVVVANTESGEERTYTIVGETESDVKGGRISWKSPLAKALIGRRTGEEAEVPAPGGKVAWEILEVRYR